MSGHPLVAGQAQDRESLPAKDRRSTTEPTPPTVNAHIKQEKMYLQSKVSRINTLNRTFKTIKTAKINTIW